LTIDAATSSNSGSGIQSTGAASSVGGSGSQSAANSNSGSSNSQSAAATSSNSNNGQSNSAAATSSSSSSNSAAAATTTTTSSSSSSSNSAAATSSVNGGASSSDGFIAPITAQNALYGNCPYSTTITDSLSNTRTIPTSVLVAAPSAAPTTEATYTYVGCFVDSNGARVVDGTAGYEASGGNSGVGQCLDYCLDNSAEFAAVGAFGECLCSNTINEQNGCSHKCSDVCNAEDDAICGGPSAAQVYAQVLT
jgi:WSC domain